MEPDTELPWLLDLFCGAGGATRGYQLAGFRVFGVDIEPQPYYVGDAFYQGDALEVLRANTRLNLNKFSAIHASPPCQGYSVAGNFSSNGVNLTKRHTKSLAGPSKRHPKLIQTTRFLLNTVYIHTGNPTPWIIENVNGAPLDPDHTIRLCGTSFGLPLIRHRFFESNIPLLALECGNHEGAIYNPVGHAYINTHLRDILLTQADRANWASRCREAMGIDWMSRNELSQAIPPAYTELIGNQLMSYLTHPSQWSSRHA